MDPDPKKRKEFKLHPHSQLARNSFHCKPKRRQTVKLARLRKGRKQR